MKKYILVLLALLPVMLNAQKVEKDVKTELVQIGFISPISTNGTECYNIRNKYSYNIIAGISNGTDVLEVGQFVNIDLGDVKGVQIAGFANINKKRSDAVMVSGFCNVSGGDSKGVHISGFSNYVKNIEGVQVAGFSNVAKSLRGIQVSGFCNATSGDVIGGQVAGFANIASRIDGTQVSGFLNLTKKVKGIQVGGFLSSSKVVDGAQVSGFLNIAGKVDGFQLAPFNYCDSIKTGIPIGVLSFVKNGYNKLEIESNETFHSNVAFKLGVRQFYNIFGVSGNFNSDKTWAVSYGVGTIFKVSKKWDMNFDLVHYHISNDEKWYDDVNDLTKLKMNFNYNLNKFGTLYFGPSLNFHISELNDKDGNYNGDDILPWSNKKSSDSNYSYNYYVGATVGIRLF